MIKGTRVKHKDRGFLATVIQMGTSAAPKPLMVQVRRDDTPNQRMWFVAKHFDVISDPPKDSGYVYYLVSSVIKVDVKAEGWDAGCDECFGIQQICSAPGYNSLSNKDEIGVRVIGYSVIEQKEFDKHKYDLFTEEGGI